VVREAFDGAAALVGVNVVRPVGRSTLTPRARSRDLAALPGPWVFPAVAWLGSVEGAGPGSGLSEEPIRGQVGRAGVKSRPRVPSWARLSSQTSSP
jgi:hypothetical protein